MKRRVWWRWRKGERERTFSLSIPWAGFSASLEQSRKQKNNAVTTAAPLQAKVSSRHVKLFSQQISHERGVAVSNTGVHLQTNKTATTVSSRGSSSQIAAIIGTTTILNIDPHPKCVGRNDYNVEVAKWNRDHEISVIGKLKLRVLALPIISFVTVLSKKYIY